MKYHSTTRRRARQARRLIQAGARPAVIRHGRVVPTFWWDGHPNFGDAITPWLLPRYSLVPVYRRPADARLFGVGSILEFAPPGFAGAIWGSGLMNDQPFPLPSAEVLAVRGPHTRDLIGAPGDIALGDPGLLVARHMRRPRLRWEVGIVPHGHHRRHAGLVDLTRRNGARVHVVNVHQGLAAAAREIAACSSVFSSSLHGLVTADSFGIPASWTTLDPPLDGGVFKFNDYESVVTPGQTRFLPFDDGLTLDDIVRLSRQADASDVTRVGDDLENALRELPARIGPLRRFPVGRALTRWTPRTS